MAPVTMTSGVVVASVGRGVGGGMGVAWKGQLLQQLLVMEASEESLHSLAILIREQMLGSTSQRPVCVRVCVCEGRG